MIARHWRGLVRRDRAAAYVEHLQSETLPQLVQLAGFLDAKVLRRDLSEGAEFLVVTIWESIDSIRAFAGNDVESAVVPPKARDMMIEYDRKARHYDVVD
ncbi:MAG TPA: antibiotic biosynthesis monooxygenase [Steroidobacteraceae bacterium]|jgi:heme-degrading monooxygenase HmoA|nr:antibiotic biosynthesis monooxygenase [Steroidobacteraceae bacterium]